MSAFTLAFDFGENIARLINDPTEFAKALNAGLTADITAAGLSGNTDDLTQGTANLFMTAAEQTKLANIEALATADQSDAEIQTAWEAATGITSADIVERDGSVAFTGPPVVPSYTVAGVPSASPAAQIAYITDETGGATLAFTDGTNWRRATDLAVIS